MNGVRSEIKLDSIGFYENFDGVVNVFLHRMVYFCDIFVMNNIAT
jgi:hypothetical protein